MKKALLVLVALCVAGVFSAKAQSPSDSAYARDLSYTFFNISSLPNTVTDSLGNGGKILKDIRANHRAKGYAIILTSTKTLDIFLNETSWDNWDEYLLLLDSNYNLITYNDDASGGGSRIIRTLAPGNYYILASEYSYSSSLTKPYTLTIDEIVTTPLNALSYTPLGSVTDTTVYDTFVASYPNIHYDNYNYIYKAKGYSFQGTQNDYIIIQDSYNDALYILMDNNHNVLRIGRSIAMQLPQTSTYYLAILDYENYECRTRIRAIRTFPTYYIDGVNGSDSRNGLTPQTAVFTLDTAIARTGGIGKYYITDDYTFRNDNALEITYAQIYPYQKDIKLKIASSNYRDIISISNHLLFGEQGSNYYFILDSNRNYEFDDFLDASYYGSYLEVNNLKARNSYFPYNIFGGDQVVLRNCEFTNDTTDYSLFKLETRHGNSIKFINCSISQNYFIDGLYFIDYDSVSITFENTIVSNNLFGYTAYCRGGGKVNLTSGSWQNNNFDENYDANNNPNLNTQNCAGIWLENSTANFGAGFTMDANNYLCIDSTSTLNITENLNGNNVAQIYPFTYDYDNDQYTANYYEGRRVLWGSTSLLANNYQKFSIAQADNTSLWYLHPDGTIHTFPVGIDQAEEGTISLYPNPATDVLNIALQGTEVNEVAVIDIYGKAALRANVAEGSNTLDISALPAGLYFVQLRAAGSVKATQKIVKR